MRNTNNDIEEPVKKSWTLLMVCILILAFMLGIGIFLLVEALQKPVVPEETLDMKRMFISGVGVILFSLAILVFLYSLYKPGKKKKTKSVSSKRKSVKRKRRTSR
ncbi:MAG: hypothetical protein M0P26_01460 [Bacteroidales bacterium]|nr:hypothetical protein [Bacteroidales bacterium]